MRSGIFTPILLTSEEYVLMPLQKILRSKLELNLTPMLRMTSVFEFEKWCSVERVKALLSLVSMMITIEGSAKIYYRF